MKKEPDEANDIAKFLFEMGYLKHLKRSGWGIIGVPDAESVAEHSHRASILGFLLAELSGADPLKTATICMFHDIAETRVGDLHRVAKRYVDVKEAEERALFEQVQRLPQRIASHIIALIQEYEERAPVEGQLARDADLLECILQAREYQRQGHVDADDWITGCYNSLQTPVAKQLADACIRVEPKEWWAGLKIGG